MSALDCSIPQPFLTDGALQPILQPLHQPLQLSNSPIRATLVPNNRIAWISYSYTTKLSLVIRNRVELVIIISFDPKFYLLPILLPSPSGFIVLVPGLAFSFSSQNRSLGCCCISPPEASVFRKFRGYCIHAPVAAVVRTNAGKVTKIGKDRA